MPWQARCLAALGRIERAWLDSVSDHETVAAQTFLEAILAQNWPHVDTTLLLLIGYGWTMGPAEPSI